MGTNLTWPTAWFPLPLPNTNRTDAIGLRGNKILSCCPWWGLCRHRLKAAPRKQSVCHPRRTSAEAVAMLSRRHTVAAGRRMNYGEERAARGRGRRTYRVVEGKPTAGLCTPERCRCRDGARHAKHPGGVAT